MVGVPGFSVWPTPTANTVAGGSRSCTVLANCSHAEVFGLAYASQQEGPFYCNISRAQKIRLRLGGSDLFEPFLEKPRGVHWWTCLRLLARGNAVEAAAFGHFALVRALH